MKDTPGWVGPGKGLGRGRQSFRKACASGGRLRSTKTRDSVTPSFTEERLRTQARLVGPLALPRRKSIEDNYPTVYATADKCSTGFRYFSANKQERRETCDPHNIQFILSRIVLGCSHDSVAVRNGAPVGLGETVLEDHASIELEGPGVSNLF